MVWEITGTIAWSHRDKMFMSDFTSISHEHGSSFRGPFQVELHFHENNSQEADILTILTCPHAVEVCSDTSTKGFPLGWASNCSHCVGSDGPLVKLKKCSFLHSVFLSAFFQHIPPPMLSRSLLLMESNKGPGARSWALDTRIHVSLQKSSFFFFFSLLFLSFSASGF